VRVRIVAGDPAWRFRDKLPGAGRGAAKNYRVDSEAEIAGVLGVELAKLEARLANDAVLFLWRVASQVPLAYRIASAWGFEAKSELVWIKTRESGAKHIGMGRTVRNSHETCIIATRGRPLRASASVRSWFEAPVPTHGPSYCGRNGEWCVEPEEHDRGLIIHSAKPHRFFDVVEELYGRGPRLELFGRRPRDGWIVTGDQMRAPARRAA
jgi:site-specific DNA-methyltransferase (adenine-specific)